MAGGIPTNSPLFLETQGLDACFIALSGNPK